MRFSFKIQCFSNFVIKNGVHENFHTFVCMFFTEYSHICDPILHSLFLSLSLSRTHSSKYYDKWSRIECSESKQMRVPLPSSDKNYFNNSTCHVQEGEKQRKRNKRKTMNRGEGNGFIKFGHTIWTNFNNIINYFHHLNKAFFLLPLLWKEELWEKSSLDWSLCLWYSTLFGLLFMNNWTGCNNSLFRFILFILEIYFPLHQLCSSPSCSIWISSIKWNQ